MLKKFIFSCFNSLEKAKKCIEMFCTHRRNMPEVYTNRDPAAKKIQDAFSTINVVQYDAGPNEILIHKLQEFNDKFDFYAAVMSFTLQADNWVKQPLNTLYDGQIIILDMQEYTLLLVPKCNVFYFQKFILFLLDGMPIRLKDIHLVNCPPYAEYMYNMVKGVLPEDIRNMVKFHTTCDSLRDCIDKKFLPEDYGGDAQCMKNENLRWVKEIQEQRDFYMNNDLWKADLSKKRKTVESETITNGSFRSLVID